MQFDILTIFPEMFQSPLEHSILKRAISLKKIRISILNIRDFAEGPHRNVDDIPYGGGAGMVFKPEPLVRAIESIGTVGKRKNILLTPRGRPLTQEKVEELAGFDQLILVCGRYEGVDERVVELKIDEEISVGDYILSGGELAALLIIDAVSRLIPGVLGNEDSLKKESFVQGLLEHPHYTRPEIFRGLCIPPVLRSGNHKDIETWRRQEALKTTLDRRPDLLKKARLSPREESYLKELQKGEKSG